MTSVIQWLERSRADWLTDDQRAGENQTGHRSLRPRQLLSEAMDLRNRGRQPQRRVKILDLRKNCFWGSWMVGCLQCANAPEALAPGCSSEEQAGVSQLLLGQNQLSFHWVLKHLRGTHELQARFEHEYKCYSLETWNLEVHATCSDETMSQRNRP